MSQYFLQEELYRIPVPLLHSWPFVESRLSPFLTFFTPQDARVLSSRDDQKKVDFCNNQLRLYLNSTEWTGSWRMKSDASDSAALGFPICVPELTLASSAVYITRSLYGSLISPHDLIHLVLSLLFCVICGTMIHTTLTEDAPIFVVEYEDCSYWSMLGHMLTNTRRPPCFRLTVIYTRCVAGTTVFKRKYSEHIKYLDLLDIYGNFDSQRFEKWIRAVVLNAMSVPYGSAWNLYHLTLT
ncbi:SubName: Full=Uncharacterized protein {ECO:0000313/EMBL:CCA71984.1} [Serendipita indica DSM 11827]|nr:SubName: Full=Uncharacterized protein {ECO:0000313/EMBL:CCA71984.1} [Serendipita indica DSM 11827]